MAETAQHLLVFGASGAIGQAICTTAVAQRFRVTAVARSRPQGLDGVNALAFDPFQGPSLKDVLAGSDPVNAACWAQGANASDSIYDVDLDRHLEIYRANVAYILVSLQALLAHNLLAPASRLCVISSIWQNLARQAKLSYCVSKSALQGLVLSAAADLAQDGHLMNAILPGALDTPMTRRNLQPEQIERLSAATGFGRLPALEDVASLACYLCSQQNTGITGQFIAADLGFSHVRIV